jgi:hypothetical protein
MGNEVLVVVLDEDFSEDSMLGILVISFHHFLVVIWGVDQRDLVLGLILVRILRCVFVFHSKMLFSE